MPSDRSDVVGALPADAAYPLLSEDVVAELRSLDADGSMLLGLVETLRADAAVKLVEMHDALDAGRLAELARVAHGLCGSARALGLVRLAAAAKDLQNAARGAVDPGAVPARAALDAVVLALPPSLDALRRYVGR